MNVTRIVTPIVIVVVALLAAAGLVSAIGVSPADAAVAFWTGTFGTPVNFGVTLTQAVPLFLVALGWIVSTKAGRLHVGFPGQIITGGTFATTVGLMCTDLPSFVALPLTVIAGIVGGALWAAVTAWLWAVRGVLEIVSSLLLNLVAVEIATWLIRGPLRGSVDGQPQSATFPSSTLWPSVPGIPGGALSFDVLLMPICAVLLVLVFSRTRFGFDLRASGGNETAAHWSGMNPKRIGVLAILVSGGFAGLAGAALLFAGSAPWMSDGFEAGVGFNGIAVALLARNSPIGAILAAVVFSALNVGSTALQAKLDVPSSLAAVLQGAVIVLVLLSVVVLTIRSRRGAGTPGAGTPGAGTPVAGSPVTATIEPVREPVGKV
ncbi:ABC transporter permease [Plantibacter sp. YIM 135347]|uniref:ABC transporter permease n=1 Tax=Plantibacter sp. YIM 135347 TaxID=3423919 RepID=UPI003D34CA0A